MKRITEKEENGFYKLKKGQEIYGEENGIRLVQIVGQLEDIKEELGVDLIPFLKEMNHLIKNSSQTTGYTTSGKKITTDYGYVEDFLKQLKEALE